MASDQGTEERLESALADRYRIESEIGRGGMATVYLAEDLKHRRKVAVKVLDPEISAVVGSERFLAEIETTANLQHPHILPLFDSGEADGLLFYVMPFIEGESLRDRLDRETQLPVEDAVRIAREVADGLSHAHGLGVIHRDIKPENVLLSGGHALIADFGIARAVTVAGGTRLTETGLSLGTPHYMSPEQATGEVEVDARSDLYSLGCVIYEMLAGEAPHTGPNAQAIISKVLTQTAPRLREVRETVPPNVELAVAKALARLPADRWSSAEEFSRALSDARLTSGVFPAFGSEEEEDITPAAAWKVLAPRILSGAVVLALVTAGLTWLLSGDAATPPPPGPVTAFPVHSESPLRGSVILSPDGRTLAYPTREGIVIRRLDQEDASLIPGTAGFGRPHFSPDGRSFGLFRAGEIWRVSAAGGDPAAVARLTPAGIGYGWTWRTDSTFIYAAGDGLWEVSDRGGEARRVVPLPEPGKFAILAWPHALPGGRKIVYTVMETEGICGDGSVVVHDLVTDERVTVKEEATNGVYSPSGHILYASADGTISAVPFDPDRMEVTGPPFTVETGVLIGVSCGAWYAVSEGGTFAFARGSVWESELFYWADRNGEEISPIGPPVTSVLGDLSPDGTLFATWLAKPGNSDVYTIDTRSGEQRRVTSYPGAEDSPVWSPDGRQLAYHVAGEDGDHLVEVVEIGGSGAAKVVYSTREGWLFPMSWSPQGWLAFQSPHLEGGSDITAIRVDGSEEALTVAGTEFNEYQPRFSPDGRWLAYVSDETGRYEVYVVPFPALDRRYAVSSDGGAAPLWSHDGDELFFYQADTTYSVRVSTSGGVFQWETPRWLFSGDVYGISPDGQRFLRSKFNPDAPVREIHVVVNWFEVLKEKEGGGGDDGSRPPLP